MVELTRRAALAVLAAGVGSSAGCLETPRGDRADGPTPDLDVLVAAAEVVYPSAVEGHREFVETYVPGRVADRPTYRRVMARTVDDLDDAAFAWYGDTFPALSADTRDSVLRETGAETADPDPDPEAGLGGRMRYYVVNELLYALYSSPAGGTLVGSENPVGHPGGTASYQRGPKS